MAKTFRSSDPYQASTRNFGQSTPPRRAPVDAVDAKISEASKRIGSLCQKMAEAKPEDRPVLQNEVTQVVREKALLQVERDRVISEFFYGKRTL